MLNPVAHEMWHKELEQLRAAATLFMKEQEKEVITLCKHEWHSKAVLQPSTHICALKKSHTIPHRCSCGAVKSL